MNNIIDDFKNIRSTLEKCWSAETSQNNLFDKNNISKGQCAVTAALLSSRFNFELVSFILKNESHWLNKVKIGSNFYYLDLTCDQFNIPLIYFIKILPNDFYFQTEKKRTFNDLNKSTIYRLNILSEKFDEQF